MDSDFLQTDPANWWIDKMYLQTAFAAARHSVDPRTQVGAVLVVPSVGVLLSAWNHVPPQLHSVGYPRTPETKNYCTEHAERAVIFKALKNGLRTDGLTMYCTWAACSECSRCIIEFGIKRVVTLSRLVDRTDERWRDSIRTGLEMMEDARIQVVGWNGTLGTKYSIRFGGSEITDEDLK
jgi:deoxycytidylate deaminase